MSLFQGSDSCESSFGSLYVRTHNGAIGSQNLVPLLLNDFHRLVEISSQLNVPGPLNPETDLSLPVGYTIQWATEVDLKI
jgi:hypothetical protein